MLLAMLAARRLNEESVLEQWGDWRVGGQKKVGLSEINASQRA
jgi:hypothetical protein